jgi:hypothetical protein
MSDMGNLPAVHHFEHDRLNCSSVAGIRYDNSALSSRGCRASCGRRTWVWYARHLCIRDLHIEHVAIAPGDSSIAADDPVIRFLGCAGCNTLETLQRPLSLPPICFDCRISCPDPYIRISAVILSSPHGQCRQSSVPESALYHCGSAHLSID